MLLSLVSFAEKEERLDAGGGAWCDGALACARYSRPGLNVLEYILFLIFSPDRLYCREYSRIWKCAGPSIFSKIFEKRYSRITCTGQIGACGRGYPTANPPLVLLLARLRIELRGSGVRTPGCIIHHYPDDTPSQCCGPRLCTVSTADRTARTTHRLTDTSHSTHQSASSASHLGPGAGAPPQPHRAVPETHTHRPRTPRPDKEIVVSDGPRAALRRGQHASAASPRGLDLGIPLDALVRLGLGSIAGQAAERLVAKGVPRPAELRSAGGGRRG